MRQGVGNVISIMGARPTSNNFMIDGTANIDTSIGIKPTWWNNWVKAPILAKQGKRTEAVASAEQAQKLGKGDEVYEGFFKDQVAKAIADWKKA